MSDETIPPPAVLHSAVVDEWAAYTSREVPAPPQIDRSKRQFTSIKDAGAALGRPIDPRLVHCFNQPRFEQRTPLWYTARMGAITASSFGAASGDAEYGTPIEVFRKKTETNADVFPASALAAMAHGNKYEDAAAYRYEKETGNTILDFGLLSHWKLFAMKPDNVNGVDWLAIIHSTTKPVCLTDEQWEEVKDLRWIKGSPDGITTNGILIEIKCPVSRFTPGIIKRMYNAQVQVNMEIAGVDRCHFIQYVPQTSWMFGEKYDCFEVRRDGEWFAQHKEKALVTWKWIEQFRETGQLPEEVSKKIRQVPDTNNNGTVAFESLRKRSAEATAAAQERARRRLAEPHVTGASFVPFDGDDTEWSTLASRLKPAVVESSSPPTPQPSGIGFIAFDDGEDEWCAPTLLDTQSATPAAKPTQKPINNNNNVVKFHFKIPPPE